MLELLQKYKIVFIKQKTLHMKFTIFANSIIHSVNKL